MKKILIVSSFIPPIAGGAERVTWQIAVGLREKFEVHILTAGAGHFDEVKDGIKIHYIHYQYPLSLYYSTIGKKYIDEFFSRYHFDLINTQLVLPWGYLLRKYPVKKVITDHAIGIFVYKRNSILRMIDERNAKIAFNRASLVISSSKWSADKIEKDFGIKVHYVPNGVNLKRFFVNRNVEKQNVILFFGRYIELKGIKYLLEAAKKLPMYEFWFAGRGPLENIIKGDNIRNYGYVDKLEEFISKATVCIFPSFIEASPLVGLEAMACGKPVIATQMGFSEYIEHGKDGLIIKPKSADAIIESINLLMNNYELRKTLGMNARKKAEQYSWDSTCNQYADLFQKTIDGEI